MQNESGRSLVEMLGTLAVMGILSLGGIAAFHSAMNKNRINTLIQEAQKRAVVASAQIMLHGQKPNLVEFDASNATEMGRFGAATQEGLTNQFGIQISYMDRSACQALLNAIGDKTPIRRLSYPSTPTVPLTECDEVGEYLIIYNNDLSPEDKAVSTTEPEPEPAQECETDTDCKTVCGTCQKESNEERGVCVNECELPPNSCTYDADCNTQNQCLVCDLTTHSCKDGCTRVEFLESTGTQYIDTDFKPNTNTRTIGRVCFNSFVGSNADYVFGVFKSPNNYGFNVGSARQYFNVPWGSSSGIPLIGLIPQTNKDYDFDISKTGYLINGQSYGTISSESVNSTRNMFLFWSNGTSASGMNGRIYYLKIYDNGVLVRDFIPAIDSNDTPCMFDKVSKKLFCNSGTGTFKTNKDPL